MDAGVREESEPRQGLGLESMRARAEEIGATIVRTRLEGGGTRVAVRFDPRGKRDRMEK